MTNAQLVPAILVPLLVWRYYQRFRRHIGRQTFHATRMTVSIVVMGLILGLITASAFQFGTTLWGLVGGLALGLIIGFVGYRITQFEVTPQGKFYTPNAYLGVAVSLLLIGRFIYRFFILYSSGLPDGGPPNVTQSPLTLFVLGLTFGYYMTFNLALVLRMRKEGPTALPT